MRRTIILILAVLSVIPVSAQPASRTAPGPYSPEYMKGIYDKREVRITMRDGVELFTSIYEPKDRTVRHPIMMERTCYTISPQAPVTDWFPDDSDSVVVVPSGRQKSTEILQYLHM